jgi:hypothetical protein
MACQIAQGGLSPWRDVEAVVGERGELSRQAQRSLVSGDGSVASTRVPILLQVREPQLHGIVYVAESRPHGLSGSTEEPPDPCPRPSALPGPPHSIALDRIELIVGQAAAGDQCDTRIVCQGINDQLVELIDPRHHPIVTSGCHIAEPYVSDAVVSCSPR